jgi:hypothetical protein
MSEIDEYEVRCPGCYVLVSVEQGENAALARRDAVTFFCRACYEQQDPA